jgi:uncharacterized protein (TIGR01777 family)
MMSILTWSLILVQMALGIFDILFHHELTERLAWRPTQKRELMLHGARNLMYAGLFLVLGWVEPHGALALIVLAALAVEVVITLIDFVEEDRSRKLPETERVAHTLLALNYGAILMLLIPALLALAARPTGFAVMGQGLWSGLATFASVGVLVFAARDFAASARCARLWEGPAAPLAAALPGRTHILITGATGFIGPRLVEALVGAGHAVTVLVRDPRKAANLGAPLTVVTDLDQITPDTRIGAVINLAGEPIADGMWTLRKRREIVRSRLNATRGVRRLIQRLDRRPSVVINGSAIGWYGLREDEILDESAPVHDDGSFSHRLVAAWEDAAAAIEALGVRVVRLRIGLVFGIQGGMVSRLLFPFEFGLGGPIGSGRQWASWITRDDLVRMIIHAIATPSLSGPLNGTAPNPVRNVEFARSLGRALGRPAFMPLPAWPLRAALGPFADELLLGGQRVVPTRALASGFVFAHPDLDAALDRMVGKAPRKAVTSFAPTLAVGNPT